MRSRPRATIPANIRTRSIPTHLSACDAARQGLVGGLSCPQQIAQLSRSNKQTKSTFAPQLHRQLGATALPCLGRSGQWRPRTCLASWRTLRRTSFRYRERECFAGVCAVMLMHPQRQGNDRVVEEESYSLYGVRSSHWCKSSALSARLHPQNGLRCTSQERTGGVGGGGGLGDSNTTRACLFRIDWSVSSLCRSGVFRHQNCKTQSGLARFVRRAHRQGTPDG